MVLGSVKNRRTSFSHSSSHHSSSGATRVGARGTHIRAWVHIRVEPFQNSAGWEDFPDPDNFFQRGIHWRSEWWWHTPSSLVSGLRRRTSEVTTPRPYSSSHTCNRNGSLALDSNRHRLEIAGSNVHENGVSVRRINHSYHEILRCRKESVLWERVLSRLKHRVRFISGIPRKLTGVHA